MSNNNHFVLAETAKKFVKAKELLEKLISVGYENIKYLLEDHQVFENYGLPQFSVLLLVLIALITYKVLRSNWVSKKKEKILIIGPSGSGKTALFFRLIHQKFLNTFASMQINQDIYTPKVRSKRSLLLLDLPGHLSLRYLIDSHINEACGVIFVVDSSDIIARVREIAELMKMVIKNKDFKKGRLPMLIVCNKSDNGLKSHSEAFILSRIEKEIDTLLETEGSLEGEENLKLKDHNKKFSFGAYRTHVTVTKLSVASGENMLNIEEFIKNKVNV